MCVCLYTGTCACMPLFSEPLELFVNMCVCVYVCVFLEPHEINMNGFFFLPFFFFFSIFFFNHGSCIYVCFA